MRPVTGDGPVRALGGSFPWLGPCLQPVVAEGAAATDTRDPVFATQALARFVAALKSRPAPVIVDLGPAVGANVTFLGEQLGCKLFVEDLLADVKSAAGVSDAIPRLSHADECVDGVLCWDVLDHFSPKAGQALAAELVRVLRPAGAVLLCHGTESSLKSVRIRYEIVDEKRLRYRFGEGSRPRRVLQSREVTQLFASLTIADSVLLTSRMREVLFRKPSASASAG